MVDLPTFTIKSTIHVGKYTSPMDGMGKWSEKKHRFFVGRLVDVHILKLNGNKR